MVSTRRPGQRPQPLHEAIGRHVADRGGQIAHRDVGVPLLVDEVLCDVEDVLAAKLEERAVPAWPAGPAGDSNLSPSEVQACLVMPRGGFEPPAYPLGGDRSIQLSYRGAGRILS